MAYSIFILKRATKFPGFKILMLFDGPEQVRAYVGYCQSWAGRIWQINVSLYLIF